MSGYYIWRRNTGGQPIYEAQGAVAITGNGRNPVRTTFKIPVTKGRYDVRIKRLTADVEPGDTERTMETQLLSARFIQDQTFDVGGQTRVGMTIKASGQINGSVDRYSAWANAKTEDLSANPSVKIATENPAWWFLRIARGIYHPTSGKLLAGAGLADSQIDIAAITAWATFCSTSQLFINAVFDARMSVGDALSKVARVGRGSISFASGKLGVVWDAPNLAPVAMFGPHNMKPDSFTIVYATEKTADEVVVRFFNSDNNYKPDTIRILVPGASTTGQNPAEIDLFGVVYVDQAKREGNLVAASQLWRRRRISWETDLEGLIVSRGDVVLLSHDLTSWGSTGRFFAAASTTSVTLDKPVTGTGGTQWIAFRRPDNATLTYHRVTPFTGSSATITLIDALPVRPGADGNHHVADYVWLFDANSTPGKKVKILSIEPIDEDFVRITATDENAEYYACENNLVAYAPGGAGTVKPFEVTNLRATTLDPITGVAGAMVNSQIDWDISGAAYDRGEVYVAEGDGPLTMLGVTTGTSFQFMAKVDAIYTIKVVAYPLDSNNPAVAAISWSALQGTLVIQPPTLLSATEYKEVGPNGGVDHGVTLAWTASVTPKVIAYTIEGRVVAWGGVWENYGTAAGDSVSINLYPVVPNVTYEFRIRTVLENNVVSEWALFDPFVASAVAPPTSVTATPIELEGPNGGAIPGVTMNWVASTEPNLLGYVIEGNVAAWGNGWQHYGSTTGSATSITLSPILSGVVYQLRIRAVAVGGAHSVWVSPSNHTGATIAPPTSPTTTAYNLAGPNGGVDRGVRFSWTASTNGNVSAYSIEGNVAAWGNGWQNYGTVDGAKTAIELAPLIAGVTYQFRVKAVTANGEYSNWAQATDFAVSAVVAPTTLVATELTTTNNSGGSIRGASLTWVKSTDTDIIAYTIEGQVAAWGNGWQNYGTAAGDAASIVLTPLVAGVAYQFRVRAVTSKNEVSAWTATASLTTAAVAAPATISFVNGTATVSPDGTVGASFVITWPASTSPSVQNYEVQGKPSAAADWISLGTVTDLRFVYAPVVPGVSYHARVRAIDTMGSQSAWTTSSIVAATGDNTGPAAPTSLTTQGGLGYIDLKWVNPTDADYSHTEVWSYTSTALATPALVGTVRGTTFSHSGFSTASVTTKYYRVRAVDYTGNAGAWNNTVALIGSSEALSVTGDTTAPAQVTGLALSSAVSTTANGEQTITLTATWSAVADSDLAYYEVDIKEGAGNYVTFATGTNLSYSWPVKPATSYTVRVRAVDDSLNLGAYSTEVASTSTSDTTAPSAATSFGATASVRSAFLTWVNGNAAADYDLASVEVFRNTTNNSGTAVAIATVNATRGAAGGFTDTGLSPQTTYYYWIKSVDSSGNRTAFSTVATVTTIAVGNSDIAVGTLTGDRITAATISGDRFITTTSLPGTITVGATGVSIGTVQTNADTAITDSATALAGANTALSGTLKYRTTGAPTNNPAPSGITITSNTNGTANIRLDWGAYTQGTNQADFLILFWRKDGTAPTVADSSLMFNVSAAASYYIFEGVNPADTYSFGLAAARRTESGLEIGTIQAPTTAPDWLGVTSGTPNYTANVGGTAAATVVTNAATGAQDPGTRINAGSTTIDPGKILISGATTLASWRNGTDATKIEGGSIAANTISANKLLVGLRGVEITGIAFSGGTDNKIKWTAGTIQYTNDSGTSTSASISANSTGVTWTTGIVYVYWVKGATSLSTTTTRSTAAGADNVILATYTGGTGGVIANYGKTIIDGASIVTGSITSTQLSTSALTAYTGTFTSGASGQRIEMNVGGTGKTDYYDSAGSLWVSIGSTTVGGSTAGGALKVLGTSAANPVYFENGTTTVKIVCGIGSTTGTPLDVVSYNGIALKLSSSQTGTAAYLMTAEHGRDYPVAYIRNTRTTGNSSHGVRVQSNNGSNSSLICVSEASGGWNFYAETNGGAAVTDAADGAHVQTSGAYGPFTGGHDALLAKETVVEVGDILSDETIVNKVGISDTISTVVPSIFGVGNPIGVLVSRNSLTGDWIPNGLVKGWTEIESVDADGNVIMMPVKVPIAGYADFMNTHDYITINSLGEGQINVCGEGGDLQPGDLIVASNNLPGKGMKQADDIVRSRTVAKVREAVTFDGPNDVKMVACVYLCG